MVPKYLVHLLLVSSCIAGEWIMLDIEDPDRPRDSNSRGGNTQSGGGPTSPGGGAGVNGIGTDGKLVSGSSGGAGAGGGSGSSTGGGAGTNNGQDSLSGKSQGGKPILVLVDLPN